jgi:hypothetical protein
MKILRALALLVLIATPACQSPAGSDPSFADLKAAAFVVESGTSFGMCAGYCSTRLVVDDARATLIETAWRSELPDRTRTVELTAAERSRFYAAADTAAVHRLAGVHGCPDCADGGAEWITVGRSTVKFDFGKELAGLVPLQREIRALRARFPR